MAEKKNRSYQVVFNLRGHRVFTCPFDNPKIEEKALREHIFIFEYISRFFSALDLHNKIVTIEHWHTYTEEEGSDSHKALCLQISISLILRGKTFDEISFLREAVTSLWVLLSMKTRLSGLYTSSEDLEILKY